jgi:hypothetical protein
MLNRRVRAVTSTVGCGRSPSGPDHQDPAPTRSHRGRTHQRRRPGGRSAALGTGGRERTLATADSRAGSGGTAAAAPVSGGPVARQYVGAHFSVDFLVKSTRGSHMLAALMVVATEKSVLVAAVDVAANAGYASGR